MKKLLCLLIVISFVLSGFSSIAFAEENYLLNESFENGMGDFTNASSKTNVEISKDKAASGTSSVYAKDDSDETAIGVSSPRIAIFEGVTYTLSADIFAIGNKGMKLYLRYTDQNKKTLVNKSAAPKEEGKWETVSITETAPGGATHIQAFVMSSGSGKTEAYIDNIRLSASGENTSGGTQAPDSKNDVSGKTVVSESFESGLGTFKYATVKTTETDVVNTTEKATDGSKSMHIKDATDDAAYGVASSKVKITAGKTYTLSVDIFAISSGGVPAYLRYTDEKGTKLVNKSVKAKSKGVWETVTLTETAPDTAAYAEIFVMSSGVGSSEAYVDNVKLTEVESETPNEETKFDEINKSSIVLFVGSANALVNGNKTLIDTTNDKVIATIVDGRTLVPVRFIAENFGAEVGWDDLTRTVTLTLKDKTVKIVLDKAEIDINGEITSIDVPAQSLEGRTMLPLRAFVENVMGKKIFWDARGLIVITDTDMLNAETDKDVIDTLIEKIK